MQQRLGYDTSAVNHHWGALDNTALRRERRFLELDLVFPFLYGVALSASSWRTWATLGRPFHAAWLMAPVAITVLADWTGSSCSWGSCDVTQRMGSRSATRLDPNCECRDDPQDVIPRRSVAVSRRTCYKRDSLCAQTGIVEPPRHRTRRSTYCFAGFFRRKGLVGEGRR